MIKGKERLFKWTNYWLKKFESKRETIGCAFFIKKKKSGHVLVKSITKTVRRKLSETFRQFSSYLLKTMVKFGEFWLYLFHFHGVISRWVHITKCWTPANCYWRSFCCPQGPDGNCYTQVSSVKTVKALLGMVTWFQAIIKECDFEWVQVYRRQGAWLSGTWRLVLWTKSSVFKVVRGLKVLM